MSTIERAIEIAARAHAGQVDKAGAPYILHPLRVMLAVTTPHERMAAALHDVVEDCAVALAELAAEGFPREVLDAIAALTKTKGEDRLSAARRAAQNPIARVVKLADVADNMRLDRIAQPTDKDRARLREYAQVKALLEAGDEGDPRTFTCTECGETAGVVRLRTSDLGFCLEVSSFTSDLRVPVQNPKQEQDLRAAMQSAKALFAIDLEFAPFYCPKCDRIYCGRHWRRWDVFDDDGWHDSIRGVCPHGHERMLED